MALTHCGNCETRFAVGVSVCPHCGATDGHYLDGEGRPFDPGEHTVDEVRAHLAVADTAERGRVLAAERDGRSRKGVLDGYNDAPADEPDDGGEAAETVDGEDPVEDDDDAPPVG